jgi:4-oxalocrotonate tautomerase
MPFVNVRITEGATREQKQRLIEEITGVVARVLDKNPHWIHVVVEEVPAMNWGMRGLTVEQLKAASGPPEYDD